MTLTDKIIVITGGTKGLGKALAEALRKAGAIVIVSATKNSDTDNAHFIKADVTQEQEIMDLVKSVSEQYGRIDLWINNAGVWVPHCPVEQLDIERVRAMNDVNIIGTMIGSKHALIQMRKQGDGTILTILSTSALEGRPNSSGYCASKYGADGFTKSLRKETEGSSINILSVYPGGMQTHFFDEKKPEGYDSYMLAAFVADTIIANLQTDEPEEELVIKRPTQ